MTKDKIILKYAIGFYFADVPNENKLIKYLRSFNEPDSCRLGLALDSKYGYLQEDHMDKEISAILAEIQCSIHYFQVFLEEIDALQFEKAA